MSRWLTTAMWGLTLGVFEGICLATLVLQVFDLFSLHLSREAGLTLVTFLFLTGVGVTAGFAWALQHPQTRTSAGV